MNTKFQVERISLFSDAVFAIAITLMMIEIKAPHLEHGADFSHALSKYLTLMPVFIGTILSFYLIGVFWTRHHELMKHMASYNSRVVAMNLWMLLSIAFIPFSTSFVFENVTSHSPVPLLFYNINYIIASLLNYRLYSYVLDPKNGLCADDTDLDLANFRIETFFQVGVYCVVIVLAFVNPDFAGVGYGLFAVENLVARNRRTRNQNQVSEPAIQSDSSNNT